MRKELLEVAVLGQQCEHLLGTATSQYWTASRSEILGQLLNNMETVTRSQIMIQSLPNIGPIACQYCYSRSPTLGQSLSNFGPATFQYWNSHYPILEQSYLNIGQPRLNIDGYSAILGLSLSIMNATALLWPTRWLIKNLTS